MAQAASSSAVKTNTKSTTTNTTFKSLCDVKHIIALRRHLEHPLAKQHRNIAKRTTSWEQQHIPQNFSFQLEEIDIVYFLERYISPRYEEARYVKPLYIKENYDRVRTLTEYTFYGRIRNGIYVVMTTMPSCWHYGLSHKCKDCYTPGKGYTVRGFMFLTQDPNVFWEALKNDVFVNGATKTMIYNSMTEDGIKFDNSNAGIVKREIEKLSKWKANVSDTIWLTEN